MVSPTNFFDAMVAKVKTEYSTLQSDIKGMKKEVDPAAMIEMQMKMSLFSQLVETTTNVQKSITDATATTVRNLKGA